MSFLARLIAWLNVIGNGLFGLLEKPMMVLPAWLSLTVISAVLGVLMLIVFKYTSNQTAIGRVRDKIKGHLLAMKLFKDNPKVILKTPWQIIGQAFLLLFHAIRPMLVMIIPFSLLMGQLGLWYESHPLDINEQAMVVMQLSGSDDDPLPAVSLVSTEVAQIVTGPVRVPSKRQIFWQIKPKEAGSHFLTFQAEGHQVQKELSVGQGLMPVSIKRPSLNIDDVIMHPAEKPFNGPSPVQSISVDYPARFSSFLGIGLWFWAMLVIAIVAGFIFKPFFNVKI
jgi:hypothetical protein